MGQGPQSAREKAELERLLEDLRKQLGLDPAVFEDVKNIHAKTQTEIQQHKNAGGTTIGPARPPRFFLPPMSPFVPEGPAIPRLEDQWRDKRMAPSGRTYSMGVIDVKNPWDIDRYGHFLDDPPPPPDPETLPYWALPNKQSMFDWSKRTREVSQRPDDPVWGPMANLDAAAAERERRRLNPDTTYQPEEAQDIIGKIEAAHEEARRRATGSTIPASGPLPPGSREKNLFTEQHGGSAMGQVPKWAGAPIPKDEPQYDTVKFESTLQRIERRMAEAGYPLVRVAKPRTAEEQNKLYKQGRGAPGKIVTDADGYIKKSRHQAGAAMDFAFSVNGKPSWDDKHPWDMLGKIAEEEGLEWGGRWKGGPGEVGQDRPHVQMPTPAEGAMRPMQPVPSHGAAPAQTRNLADYLPQWLKDLNAKRSAEDATWRQTSREAVATHQPDPQGRRSIVEALPDPLHAWADQFAQPWHMRTHQPLVAAAAETMRPPGSPQMFDPDVQEAKPQSSVLAMPTMPGAPMMAQGQGGPPFMPTFKHDPERMMDEPQTAEGKPVFEDEGVPISQLPTGGWSREQDEEAAMEAPAERKPVPVPQTAGSWRLQPKPEPRMPVEEEPDEEPRAAAMPTWKIALTNIMNSLPDAIIGFTSAWADKPEIADNWLKQRALKIEDANERAKIAAASAKDNFERQMKLLDWEQKRADGRLNIAKSMEGLHSRVAEGKLKDLNSYFAELNLYANEYRGYGGNYEDLVNAYPVPFMDKITQLRKDFDEFWEKSGNEKDLDIKRFRHPLTEQGMTGWDAIRLLGNFDPDTGKIILSLPKLTEVKYTNAQDQDVIEFKTPAELRAGSFKQTPDMTPLTQTTPKGELLVTNWNKRRGAAEGPTTLIPGAASNESLASKITGYTLLPAEQERQAAVVAYMRIKMGNNTPTPAEIDQVDKSADPDIQSSIIALQSSMKAAKAQGKPPAPSFTPWNWVPGMRR